MAKRSLGLATLKLGNIAGDGGMGTSLTAIGDTVQDTAVLSNDENQLTDFFSEEQDDPVESIVSQKGKFTLSWSSYNVDPDIMVKLFGGTKTGDGGVTPYKWAAPASIPDVEQSIELVDKKGNKIEIVRAKLTSKLQWNFKKTALAQIDIVATVLTPTKANTAPYSITYA